MTTPVIVLIVIGVVALLLIGMYNSLVAMNNRVKEALSDIGVQQKRRHNIIPNLVETVKGYAKHESSTLEAVVQARNSAMSAGQSGDLAAMAQAETALTASLKSIFALAESYPDLKANQNFMHLQQELVDAEDKIMAASRFFNATVQQFNTKVEQFPSNMIAKAFGFTAYEFFTVEPEAQAVPKVQF
jgi:LemA protein